MYEEILQYIQSCKICSLGKSDYSNTKTPLQLRPTPSAFDMDVLKVAPTKEGISTILVITDRLTKHFEVATLVNETRSEISKMFLICGMV